MRHFLLSAIVLAVFLAGCTGEVVRTGDAENIQSTEQQTDAEQPSLQRPQITSSPGAVQKTEIDTTTIAEVIKAPEEPVQTRENATEPRIFYVNIAEGIGIRESN